MPEREKLEAGSWKLEVSGAERLKGRSWKLEAGSWKLASLRSWICFEGSQTLDNVECSLEGVLCRISRLSRVCYTPYSFYHAFQGKNQHLRYNDPSRKESG